MSYFWFELRSLIAWEFINLAITVMPGEEQIELCAALHPVMKSQVARMSEIRKAKGE